MRTGRIGNSAQLLVQTHLLFSGNILVKTGKVLGWCVTPGAQPVAVPSRSPPVAASRGRDLRACPLSPQVAMNILNSGRFSMGCAVAGMLKRLIGR